MPKLGLASITFFAAVLKARFRTEFCSALSKHRTLMAGKKRKFKKGEYNEKNRQLQLEQKEYLQTILAKDEILAFWHF